MSGVYRIRKLDWNHKTNATPAEVNMRLPVSFHVHQKLVLACETKISHLSCVWLCGCVCMLVSVLSHLFCYLSCAGCWHNRCASLPPQHSPTKQRLLCTKPCYVCTSFLWFYCCCCHFKVTIERNVQELTIFFEISNSITF